IRAYLAVRPPCPAAQLFLTEWAPTRPMDPHLMSSVARHHLLAALGRLRMPLGSHTFRHSFAKTLLDRGAKLHEVGAMLGHARLRSTSRYLHTDLNQKRRIL